MSVNSINQVKPSLFHNIVKTREFNQRIHERQRTIGGGFASATPPPPPVGEFFVGVNLSGAQGPTVNWPGLDQVGYYVSKGITKFRLCLAWSNQGVGIQLTSFAALNASYLAPLDALLAGGQALGASFMLDIHGFGGGPDGPIGTGTSAAAFADLWQKISQRYGNHPAVHAYDLMNEPTNLFDPANVIPCYNAAIAAIRANGDGTLIHIDGVNFSSVWNWVTGQNQTFNSSTFYQVVDPLNNLRIAGHNYPDRDGSGTHFIYSVESADPGEAPPGTPTNPTIMPTRLAPYVAWCIQHGISPSFDEFSTSSDDPRIGGADNYAAWNVILDNTFAYLQANKIPAYIWGGGDFQTIYGYNLASTSTANNGSKDYTTAGLQTTQWVIIDKYTGYAGPQPIAYRVDLPFNSGTLQYVPQLTTSVASGNFTVIYNGVVSSTVTITPTAKFPDGTAAGGTFTPSSVTLSPGNNARATFTYTPAVTGTFVITATNNAGWINPPGVGCSSIPDVYINALNRSNFVGLRRIVPWYTGPAIRLQRDDGAQLDFFFNNRGDLPRQAIQNWANSRSIKIIRIYNQTANTNGDYIPLAVSQFFTPSTGNPPLLTLVNSAGYPEVSVASGQWMGTQSSSNGKGLLTLLARAAGSSVLISQDNFNGQFRLGSAGFFANTNGGTGGNTTVGSMSSYTTVSGTYSNLYTTNNINTYNNGTVSNSISVPSFTFAPVNADTETFINAFRFGGQNFAGAWQVQVITFDELSAADQTSINTDMNTYYSTPLPDSLSFLSPIITNTLNAMPIFPGLITARPFGAITITDPATGTPTDTVTITLTGAAGTLSGSGLTGTGPYTVGPDTPANVTNILNQCTFTTAAGVGSTTTFTLLVNSSAGTSTTNGSTSTVVTTYSTQASYTVPAGTFTPVNKCGYNLSGGELDPSFGLGPKNFQMDYLASAGFGLFRYVLCSQWMYTAPFGQMNAGLIATMKSVIDYAFSKNLYVMIDPHNFGGMWDATFSTFRDIKPNMRSQDLFQDMWRRIAAAFVNYPNVIFNLMNEPAAGGVTAVMWRDGGVTPAITAIRAVGANQLIAIPGVGGTSALMWASSGNTAAFAGYAGDPANNFCFDAHQYLDAGASGGSSVATLNGSTILSNFNSFLSANGFKGFIGEFGMAPDPFLCNPADTLHYNNTGSNVTTNSITHNSDMLTSAVSSGSYIGWAAWGGGSEWATPPVNNGYAFNPEPERLGGAGPYVLPLVTQPQVPVLVGFII